MQWVGTCPQPSSLSLVEMQWVGFVNMRFNGSTTWSEQDWPQIAGQVAPQDHSEGRQMDAPKARCTYMLCGNHAKPVNHFGLLDDLASPILRWRL
eukprot:2933898-Amphidinium_carterae.1